MRFLLLATFFLALTANAQVLKPGFDKDEYIQTLNAVELVHTELEKWPEKSKEVFPVNYRFVGRSEVVAFENMWDFWMDTTKNVGLICIRGSIATQASFLANFYSAMVPATGSLQLNKDTNFTYKLADDPKAAVQAGWFLAMAHIAKEVEHKIDSCYQLGTKDFIISGHSQGGGIAYMLTSYLRHKQLDKSLAQDIQLKTYCSAAPKPGNQFFAFDYEKITQGGWAFNVINTADWVHDMPISVQTANDFTEVNPFHDAKKSIRKQKFPKDLVFMHIYKQLDRPTRKAQRRFEKYLGDVASKLVQKQLPNAVLPPYYSSAYYAKAGIYIVLIPDASYYEKWSNDESDPKIWRHHFLGPYRYLMERY